MQELSLGTVLTRLSQQDPARPAISCGGQSVTRAELESRANRLARCYSALGVRAGDLVTLALPNGIAFHEAAFATWKLGAVPLPLSPRLPSHERRAVVELAGSSLVVGVHESAHPGRPCLPDGFRPSPQLEDGPLPNLVHRAWKALASSGTTGAPKLVVDGFTGGVDPDVLPGAHLGMSPDDVQLVAGAPHHALAFTMSALGLASGHHLVVLPRFDPQAALDAITRERVTFAALVPSMMLRMHRELVAHPGRWDLSSLRLVWHGGAPCPPSLKRAWIDHVGPEALLEMYSSTEAIAIAVLNGTEWQAHPGSVGRSVVGEIRVLDGSGQVCPPGEIGEVHMRRTPDALRTHRYLGHGQRMVDGWQSVGDLGWMDDDGYLYLVDRRTRRTEPSLVSVAR